MPSNWMGEPSVTAVATRQVAPAPPSARTSGALAQRVDIRRLDDPGPPLDDARGLLHRVARLARACGLVARVLLFRRRVLRLRVRAARRGHGRGRAASAMGIGGEPRRQRTTANDTKKKRKKRQRGERSAAVC